MIANVFDLLTLIVGLAVVATLVRNKGTVPLAKATFGGFANVLKTAQGR